MRAPIRKAFLLGAGLGTRLRPLTDALPKPLIPVLGAPLIRYAIDHCAAAGITEFAINTHHLPETWKDYFPGSREGSGESPCAPRIDFFHEPVLLETGGGIKNIEEWIAGEPILVYNGDILANLDLARLISTHRASGNLATLGVRSNGPALHLALDGRQVVDIHHKLGVAAGTHQFTGIYCIEPELLDSIPPNRKISIIPALLDLARNDKLGCCLLDEGYWLDLGTRDTYLAAQRPGSELAPEELIDPRASIDPSAEVIGSVVGSGCVVEAGAFVRDCVLWPNTKVRAGARLTNCIVYSSHPAVGAHEDADL